jgi:Zn-dependent protease with chaperone function
VDRLPVTAIVGSVLAVVMLVGFYVAGVGVVVGLIAFAIWLLVVYPGEVAFVVGGAAAAAAIGLGFALWQIVWSGPGPPLSGIAVDEAAAPALWSMARDLADASGTRPPDQIRLVPEVNAAVWEETGALGLRAGQRRLYVGVPLLYALPSAQVRAVLAHEFGHYSHQHTRLGPTAYRGMWAMERTIKTLGPGVAGVALTLYAVAYALVSAALRRRMEIEADLFAARVAGRDAVASALRETPSLDGAWHTYLASYVRWARSTGYTPAEFLAWYGWFMEHKWPGMQRGNLRPRLSTRWDSHPSVEARLSILESAPDAPDAPDPGGPDGIVLAPDTAVSEAALVSDEFNRYAERLAHEEAELDAKALYRVAGRTTVRGLADVLNVLAGEHGELSRSDLIARSIDAGADLVELVCSAVAFVAVEADAVIWRHRWCAPMALVCGGPIGLRELATRACADPAAVAPLRRRLVELGVGPSVVGTASKRIASGTAYRSGADGGRGLLLTDELFLLAYHDSGKCRVPSVAIAAGLAAAAVAELRLRGHVEIEPTPEATLTVIDPTPVADTFLDSVLAQLTAAVAARPAYEWLLELGHDVTEAVSHRLTMARLVTCRPGIPPVAILPSADATVAAAAAVRELREAAAGSRPEALGVLLWGTELSGPVLGLRGLPTRLVFRLAGPRDPLARAIRTVIGLNTPLRAG